jgi:hypothetical protein
MAGWPGRAASKGTVTVGYQVKRSLLCDTSRVIPDTRPRHQHSQQLLNDRTVFVSPPGVPDT